MDICFIKGLVVVLLIQHCKSKGQPDDSQLSIDLQDADASQQETELPGEVVPAVAPPSLKEVEEAVQEASEQVEGPGAEVVLKELLERVVEAALGEVLTLGGEKAADPGQQEVTEQEALGDDLGEAEAEVVADAGAMEETAGEEPVVEDTATAGDGAGGGEEQLAVADGEEVQLAEVEGEAEATEAEEEAIEAVAESVEEAAGDIGGGTEEDEAIGQAAVAPEVTQDTIEENEATLDQDGVGETGEEGAQVEEVVVNGEVAAEAEEGDAEVAPAAEETAAESDAGLEVAQLEQTGDEVVDEVYGGEEQDGEQAVELPADDYEEMETTQSVVGEPVEEEEQAVGEEQVEDIVVDVEGGEVTEVSVEDQAVEGGDVIIGAGVEEIDEAAGDNGESLIEGGGEAVEEEVVAAGADAELGVQDGGEQTTAETSDQGQAEDQEVLEIPAPEPAGDEDASIAPGAEEPESPLGPSLEEPESNVMGGEELLEEESNHANEIITSTEDLVVPDLVVEEPKVDNFLEEIPAVQSEGAEPGEANEQVEETADISEGSDHGLEAWKIAAISAAVLLVLETVVIIVYILKCRKKPNSTSAPEQTCEEGCVEAEAATGGDCNDDTVSAGNEDTQQIAGLEPSEPAVIHQLQEQQQQVSEEQSIAMPDLQLTSLEAANPGPDPDPPQDLRTSVL